MVAGAFALFALVSGVLLAGGLVPVVDLDGLAVGAALGALGGAGTLLGVPGLDAAARLDPAVLAGASIALAAVLDGIEVHLKASEVNSYFNGVIKKLSSMGTKYKAYFQALNQNL